jgi:hypothetical protein
VRAAIVCVGALIALFPVASAAASTPDPATLKAALADAPSSDYVEADQGTNGEGSFTASDYATRATTDSVKRSAIELRLTTDGFVTGYGRLWVKRAAGVALVEQILVFKDKSGAGMYYNSAKLGDTADPHQTGTVDTSSIPNSYGVKDLISNTYAVAVVIAKGNDILAIAAVSATGYLEADTLAQSNKVFSAAPDYTIQPASAPGIATNQLASNAGAVIVDILLVALGLGILLAIIAFVLSRRRRPASQPAASAPMIQMSPDSRFWWDGAGWQDATAVAPAHAQRTPDGAYWWDGQTWHPVPRPQ